MYLLGIQTMESLEKPDGNLKSWPTTIRDSRKSKSTNLHELCSYNHYHFWIRYFENVSYINHVLHNTTKFLTFTSLDGGCVSGVTSNTQRSFVSKTVSVGGSLHWKIFIIITKIFFDPFHNFKFHGKFTDVFYFDC